MKYGTALLAALLASQLGACAWLNEQMCAPHCHAETRSASSLVGFLYPGGALPPRDNTVPELRVPLRIGLAFLPSSVPAPGGALDAAHREVLLERIRERFRPRPFVADIVTIPDYYLGTERGFSGLAAIQRLYSVDLVALVSYDQVASRDDNALSLAYLTIVGAYVVKGTRHDVSTLVDLAVVDPATRSLVLRAGGTSSHHGSSSLVDVDHDLRAASDADFTAATLQMLEHFDTALTAFETDVRAGRAPVRVVQRGAAPGGGGGSLDGLGLALLAIVLARRVRSGAERASS